MTKPGTLLRQRELVLLPIPFTDLSSNKRRPAIGISNKEKRTWKMASFYERADKIYSISQGIVVKRFGRIKRDVFREVIKKINALCEETGEEIILKKRRACSF